jgi:hypothetical protein
MTTFKEIRGTDILALSSDPSNPEVGQIWYNSSSGTLKGYLLAKLMLGQVVEMYHTARLKGQEQVLKQQLYFLEEQTVQILQDRCNRII